MLEVRDETMEGKEKIFIDCHYLLHQSPSFSLESRSALIQNQKQKENTKEENYTKTTLKKRKPSLLLFNLISDQ